MSEDSPVYDVARYDQRRQCWRDRATMSMGRRHLDALLAAWRALAPALADVKDVLDRAHLQRLAALGPIPPQDALLHQPRHRPALETLIDDGQAVMDAADSLWALLTEELGRATSTPNTAHEGDTPDDRPAA
jgi:hypothetical protein